MSQTQRKIVFVNQATGYLTIDIINEFVKSGHFAKTALVAGSIRVQDIELSDVVEVSKIVKYDRGDFKRKLTSWVLGTIQIFFLLLFKYRKFEVIYLTVPPLAYLLSIILPNRFSVLVYDVYPDALKIHGFSETSLVYRWWSRLNRRVFRKAFRIYTLGDGMKKALEVYTGDQREVKVIANWSGLTMAHPIPKEENPFAMEHNLTGKFVVQYSGNIGATHNVEALIDVAEALRGDTDFYFLIIGRGARLELIAQRVKNLALTNCMILPFQLDHILPQSLASADLAVVTLDEKTSLVSVPSKIYNIQAVGVPILALASAESELNQHLIKYKNGKAIPATDLEQIIAFVKSLKDDPQLHLEYSRNAALAASYSTIRNARLYLDEYVR